MNPRTTNPFDYFNEWLAVPIATATDTVADVIDALNQHPLATDETAQDYVMPTRRCRECKGRFRIYGENQDVYYCFVYDGDETKANPPVYLETCLDLKIDYGINESDIINNDHVLIANGFVDFLWHVLGQYICARWESIGQFAKNVTGVKFARPVELDDSFTNPLAKEFPAGYACYISDDVVCMPGWGAAFRTVPSRVAFMNRYSPTISRSWA